MTIPVADSSSSHHPDDQRSLRAVIEEAARSAADKVRWRNERLGWPVVTEEWLRNQEEQPNQPSSRVAEEPPGE